MGAAFGTAIDVAKLHILPFEPGSGYWKASAAAFNSLRRTAEGKPCSVILEIIPAPNGLALPAASPVRHLLELAGIKDAWTRSDGNTRTTVNLAKATYNALRNASQSRLPRKVAAEEVTD